MNSLVYDSVFLLLPLKLSLYLSFPILIIIYLSIGLFVLILLWDPLCFLYLDTCFFLKFGKVLVIISSNTFSIHFSPSLFAIPIMQVLTQSYYPRDLICCTVFLFLFVWSYDQIMSTILSSKSLMCSSVSLRMPFISSRVLFILDIQLSIFYWIFFILLLLFNHSVMSNSL